MKSLHVEHWQHPEKRKGDRMKIATALRGWRAGSCAVVLGALLVAPVASAEQKGEWTSTGRTPDLQRFSPLDQIKPSNVAGLVPTWSFSTGALRGHEGNPLVINNVMYVHSAFPNTVYPLDLPKAGAPMQWMHVPAQPAGTITLAWCDGRTRGLASPPSGTSFINRL